MSKFSPSGENETGFIEGDGKGEFSCGNCVHMKDGCVHPIMKAISKQPRMKNGNVEVDEDDCCKFQRRPGDTE
jgi:hypothetical protein